MEDRETYDEIKADFLNSYYIYCQHKISQAGVWVSDEHESGYAYDQFVDANTGRHTCFHTSIEKLMVEVIAYILDGGRNEKAGEYYQQAISNIIEGSRSELIKTITGLPADERFNLVSDLKLLKIDFPEINMQNK